MDYKSVIEEQIKKLQEVQNTIIKNANIHMAPDSCKIAETIAMLCNQARYISYKKKGSTEVNPQNEQSNGCDNPYLNNNGCNNPYLN